MDERQASRLGRTAHISILESMHRLLQAFDHPRPIVRTIRHVVEVARDPEVQENEEAWNVAIEAIFTAYEAARHFLESYCGDRQGKFLREYVKALRRSCIARRLRLFERIDLASEAQWMIPLDPASVH